MKGEKEEAAHIWFSAFTHLSNEEGVVRVFLEEEGCMSEQRKE